MKYKIVVILLTWNRIPGLISSLRQLKKQTYKDFDIHITNSNQNIQAINKINSTASAFSKSNNFKINVSHDSNDYFAFRRLFVARDYAERGYDIIMFLDDDVKIPVNYVEEFVRNYEPETYHSYYTWVFHNNGENYYTQRSKVFDNNQRIHYAGTGVSMIDAKAFLNPGLFRPPKMAYKIEDLWLSYYCDHILGWKLKHVGVDGIEIGGGDSVALHKSVKRSKENKAVFLQKLVKMGWDLTS